jgi:hypothetical protein
VTRGLPDFQVDQEMLASQDHQDHLESLGLLDLQDLHLM